MFFIVWAHKLILLWLGFAEQRLCSVCGQTRQFQLALQYKLFTIYWIFGAVSQKQYFNLCTVCKHGDKVEASQAEAQIQKNPIPFMHRWGLLVGVAAVVLLVVLSAVSS